MADSKVQLTPAGQDKALRLLAEYALALTEEQFARLTGGRDLLRGLTDTEMVTILMAHRLMDREERSQSWYQQCMAKILQAVAI